MMRPNATGWFLVAFFFLGGVVFTIVMWDVWIGQIWIVVSLGLAGLYWVMNRRADQADRLKREGVRGEAEIREMTLTGTYINEQPRVKMKLEVESPDLGEFEHEDTYTVPLIALGGLGIGRRLPVYFDRREPKRFVVDWAGGASESDSSPDDRLRKLEELRDEGLITQAEYDDRRTKILDAI